MAIEKEVSESRVTVIPLVKKDCDIPGILKIKSYVDFRSGNFDNNIKSLLFSISNLPLKKA